MLNFGANTEQHKTQFIQHGSMKSA